MRTSSLAGSSEALQALSRLTAAGANRLPFYWGALALAGCSAWLRRTAGRARRLDRLFWHTVRMTRFGPDLHFAVNREIEEPFRVARCVVLHLEPFRTGLVIGWYGKSGLGEFEALRRAVSLRDPTRAELDSFDDEKVHGPGKPGGLRFGAADGRPVGGGVLSRPEHGVDGAVDAGAGQ